MTITPEMARIVDAIVALPEEARREILSLFEPDGSLKKWEAKINIKLGNAGLSNH
jgi:hypothetical protein